MTDHAGFFARLELDMFEARNAALRALVDADDAVNEALVALPDGPVVGAVCRGLDAWVVAFRVLAGVGASGGVPGEHPATAGLRAAGEAVDAALAEIPDGLEREALEDALRKWVEAHRVTAGYQHLPPRAWWKDE